MASEGQNSNRGAGILPASGGTKSVPAIPGKPLEYLVDNKVYSTGAGRGKDADTARLDLVCPTGLTEVGKIYAEGAATHGVNNYCLGMPIGETLNHALRHISIAQLGGDKEGPPIKHLAKAVWNLLTVIHFLTGCQHHVVSSNFENIAREARSPQPTQSS